MSTWFDVKVNVFGNTTAFAKFLNIKIDDVWVDELEMSFGSKNGPGIRMDVLVKNNPDLVFLVRVHVENYAGYTYLLGYNKLLEEVKSISLDNWDGDDYEYNYKILEENPAISISLKKNKYVNWSEICRDLNKASSLLNRAHQYENLSSLISVQDIEFDNLPLEN